MSNDNARLKDLKFEIAEEVVLGTNIKVIGVGGGGSNAVARMMDEGLGGVEFHIINTDQQALQASPVPNKLAIGIKTTGGLGVGADAAIGRKTALDDTEQIIEVLEGSEMVFVTAGLGGGTGTGAAPVVAALAKEMGALTVAVVTKPFSFEGPLRMKMAERGLADLASTVDTVISIPNDRLLELLPRGVECHFQQRPGRFPVSVAHAAPGRPVGHAVPRGTAPHPQLKMWVFQPHCRYGVSG